MTWNITRGDVTDIIITTGTFSESQEDMTGIIIIIYIYVTGIFTGRHQYFRKIFILLADKGLIV